MLASSMIFDFSKIEAGSSAGTQYFQHGSDSDVVNIVLYKINEQKIGLSFKDPFVPNWFFGDAKRLEQVLLNVLSNAVKLTTAEKSH